MIHSTFMKVFIIVILSLFISCSTEQDLRDQESFESEPDHLESSETTTSRPTTTTTVTTAEITNQADNAVTILIESALTIRVQSPKMIQLHPLVDQITETVPAIIHRHDFEIFYKDTSYGVLKVETYDLGDDDYYYCIRTQGTKDLPFSLEITLKLDTSAQYQYRYFSYPEGRNNVTSVLSGPFSSIFTPLSLPYTSYIEGETFTMVVSSVNRYRLRENDVLQDQVDDSGYPLIDNGQVIANFSVLNQQIDEHWGFFSKEQLVDFENEEHVALVKLADYGQFRKWTMYGQYYLTPNSYYPTGYDHYYRNVAHHVGERFLGKEGRYFENMAIVAMFTCAFTQNEKGIWYTTARSEWLYGDYGIDAYFFDTRFNTDAGLFLIRAYRMTADPILLASALKYADFLVTYATTHRFITKNQGALIWDYTDQDLTPIPNHVSLNHLVTQMNFLYEMFIDTGTSAYLETADRIRQAVHDTKDGWPKENDDLWYAYMVDGTYALQDYVNLTVRDLRYGLQLIEKIHNEQDEAFQFLIRTKERYLIANNLPLA